MKRKLTNYQYNLKNKYYSILKNNRKTSSELCNYIKNKFDIIDVSKKNDVIAKEKFEFKKNCLSSWYNSDKSLNQDNLVLNSYIIIKNSKSNFYYQKFGQKYLKDSIYVIIESNTGYISSNSDELNNELYLYRGVSNLDIINNSPDLFLYLELLNEKFS